MNCVNCNAEIKSLVTLCPTCEANRMKRHFVHIGWGESTSGAQREKLFATGYDLVPFQEMIDAYIRVAEFGAKKYAPWNWSKGLPRTQLFASLLRHSFAYLRGEERDSESGLLHTDHIIWNAAAICHSVHWNLEDGRRSEPHRDYKVSGAEPPPPQP